MYVSGACVDALPENCPSNMVFTGTECVCDQAKYLAAAEDGSCTACISQLLKYDKASGSCVCTNGADHVLVNGEIKCVSECGDNEDEVDGNCVCEGEGKFIDAKTGRCTLESECSKIGEFDDGHKECVYTETCKEAGLKLSESTCVQSCALYYTDKDENEDKCTDKCPHWWYRTRDRFCAEERWRLNTAIAVPSVVGGVGIITMGLLIFLR